MCRPVQGFTTSSSYKKRICEQCKLTEWQGQPIPIELNHTDGINTNNEYSNLEILCPQLSRFNTNPQIEKYRLSKTEK